MRNRTLALALALAFMLLSLSFHAAAETTATSADGFTLKDVATTFEGLITEVESGYFVFNAANEGPVRANLDDTTVYEGTASKDTLAVGQYVYVLYNGVMTRSLPPQISAQKVSCFEATGTVTSLLDNGFVLEGDAVLGTVVVHTDVTLPPVFLNVPVTLYYSGVMSMSMPPQISAVHLVVPELEGTVSDITEAGFTLTSANGAEFHITLGADMSVAVSPTDGARMVVYYNGQLSNGADVDALAIAASSADDNPASTTQN
jgi:hypothetical protein